MLPPLPPLLWRSQIKRTASLAAFVQTTWVNTSFFPTFVVMQTMVTTVQLLVASISAMSGMNMDMRSSAEKLGRLRRVSALRLEGHFPGRGTINVAAEFAAFTRGANAFTSTRNLQDAMKEVARAVSCSHWNLDGGKPEREKNMLKLALASSSWPHGSIKRRIIQPKSKRTRICTPPTVTSSTRCTLISAK